MYGDKIDAGMIKHEVLEYGVPIPIDILKNEKMMEQIRYYHRYNVELPGNVEDVHPLKFIPDLRPVEEFRHTPIVPISDKDMNDHKKKIEEKKRKSEFFELDKSRLKFYAISLVFGFIVYKVLSYLSYQSNINQYEAQRLRHRRMRYQENENDYM